MKRFFTLLFLCMLILSGCSYEQPSAQIAATTLPVYEFTTRLCEGTDLSVTRLVTEEVSCLHDYSLNVRQVKAAEAADIIVISGVGLEEFLEDLLLDSNIIDASKGIDLICPEDGHGHSGDFEDVHSHEYNHSHNGHSHDQDPHIWLSPIHAYSMAENICLGLTEQYPQYKDIFKANWDTLSRQLTELQVYGEDALEALSYRELITFHDGFAYFSEAFDLTILEAVEEESGSEASAKELIHLIEEVEHHHLPAIFTEKSGSVSAAEIISRETGCSSYKLDMAMTGDSYFDAMYHNIDTILEALG